MKDIRYQIPAKQGSGDNQAGLREQREMERAGHGAKVTQWNRGRIAGGCRRLLDGMRDGIGRRGSILLRFSFNEGTKSVNGDGTGRMANCKHPAANIRQPELKKCRR